MPTTVSFQSKNKKEYRMLGHMFLDILMPVAHTKDVKIIATLFQRARSQARAKAEHWF
jgi:hypothetical protein